MGYEIGDDVDQATEMLLSGADIYDPDQEVGYEIIAGAPLPAMRPRGNPFGFGGGFTGSVQLARQQAAAAAAARRAPPPRPMVQVRDRPPNKLYEMPMSFESVTTVAGLASETINITAPVPVRCRRLYIGSSIADSFTLDTLVLGLGNNIVGTAPVHCQCFAENGGRGLEWDIGTIQVGQQLQMRFTNRSGGALKLRGTWWVDALAGGPFRG